MGYFLGLDGGGTKTEAVVLNADGQEQGRGTGGPCNLATCEDYRLARSLREATDSACQQAGLPAGTRFAGVCVGVAGYSVEERRARFADLLRAEIAADAYRIEPDYVVAYWGASLGEPSILVIAGTGAVSFGRNTEGETYRYDGLGYLLGDRGSGFNLGLRVLRYTLEQMQEGRSDALSEAVVAHTGATTQNQIMQWLYGNFSTARVAGLTPVVGALAEAGDPAARHHVAAMAHQLRHAVRQVRYRLWFPPDIPVYPLGGLWQLGDFFRAEFTEPHWPLPDTDETPAETFADRRFNVRAPQHDPAYGAAFLAQQSGS